MDSAVILSTVAVLSAISGIQSGFYGYRFAVGSLSVALVALFSIVWRGGIVANPRLAISIAAIFGIVTGGMVAWSFFDFVQTGGGEGPNGEGSPLANIVALTLGATVGFCPWLLTTLLGLSPSKRLRGECADAPELGTRTP